MVFILAMMAGGLEADAGALEVDWEQMIWEKGRRIW